jgi:hypothetical protein
MGCCVKSQKGHRALKLSIKWMRVAGKRTVSPPVPAVVPQWPATAGLEPPDPVRQQNETVAQLVRTPCIWTACLRRASLKIQSQERTRSLYCAVYLSSWLAMRSTSSDMSSMFLAR